MWDQWIIDASMGPPLVCCPVKGDLEGEFTIVTGMNFIGNPPGKLVAMVHPGGQEAADEFYEANKEEIEALFAGNRNALATEHPPSS